MSRIAIAGCIYALAAPEDGALDAKLVDQIAGYDPRLLYLGRMLADRNPPTTTGWEPCSKSFEFAFSHAPRTRGWLLGIAKHDTQFDPLRQRSDFQDLTPTPSVRGNQFRRRGFRLATCT